jgi:thiol-disulfide isomerase/thioredoxin
MKSSLGWSALVVGLGVWVAPALGQSLQIGDVAPPLNFSDWVKGEPIKGGKVGGKVVFMESWATWCAPCIESIPHLTELQQKFGKDGLIVIGAASPGRGESLPKVKRFVDDRGAGIGYRIAWDKTGDVTSAYMRGVGASGIPYAFLLNRDGKLVWHGHPADPEVDVIIADVVAGKFDVETAINRERIAPMFARMRLYASRENWDAFRSAGAEALLIDPGNIGVLDALVYGYLVDSPASDAIMQVIEKHAGDHADKPKIQLSVAQALLGIRSLEKRRPALALRAAEKAYRAAEPSEFEVAAVYARALFEIGMVDKAIELQKTAVESANGAASTASLKGVLDYFKACKSLQAESM